MALAHAPDEAFYTIRSIDDTVVVRAEFPWTIRNALLNAYPELENAKTKKAFTDAFYTYIRRNFQLKNDENELLPLVKGRELLQNGHSHQTTFLLFFKGVPITLTNTTMFELYEQQKNTHTILHDQLKEHAVTSVSQPTISLPFSKSKSLDDRFYLFMALIFLVLIGGYRVLKRKQSKV